MEFSNPFHWELDQGRLRPVCDGWWLKWVRTLSFLSSSLTSFVEGQEVRHPAKLTKPALSGCCHCCLPLYFIAFLILLSNLIWVYRHTVYRMYGLCVALGCCFHVIFCYFCLFVGGRGWAHVRAVFLPLSPIASTLVCLVDLSVKSFVYIFFVLDYFVLLNKFDLIYIFLFITIKQTSYFYLCF